MKKYASNRNIRPAHIIPRVVWLRLRTKLNRRFSLAYGKIARIQRPQKRNILERSLQAFKAVRLLEVKKAITELRPLVPTLTDSKDKRKVVIRLLKKSHGVNWRRVKPSKKPQWISFEDFKARTNRYKKLRLLRSYSNFVEAILPGVQTNAKNNSYRARALILRINPYKLDSKLEVGISTNTSRVWVRRFANNPLAVLIGQTIGSTKHITKANLSIYGTIVLKFASNTGVNESRPILMIKTNHSRRLRLYRAKRFKLRNIKKRYKYYRFLRKFIAFQRRVSIVHKYRLWDSAKPLVIQLRGSRRLLPSNFASAIHQNSSCLTENQLILGRLIALYTISITDGPTPSKIVNSDDNRQLIQGTLKIQARFSKKKLKRVAKVTVDRSRRRSYLRNIIRGQFGWFAVERFRRFKQFRKQFKRWFSRFRRIKKNRLFIQMFRSYFINFTGFKETQLMHLWFPFRRGSDNHWGGIGGLVEKFSQSLLLMPASFVLFLGLAPSQTAAKVLIQSGALLINGTASANLTYHIKPGDLVQFSPAIWKYARRMFRYHRWEHLKVRLSMVSFIQVDWSLMIISIVRWPYNYELVPPNFLSERWVRYYIRQFPIHARKFQRVKTDWSKYQTKLKR